MNPERLAQGSRVSGPARTGGFTLLEVMAAVAVMGMLFITLARANIQGILAESSAARRMEAARLANSKMQEIEIQLEAGGLPLEVGITEEEESPYTIETEITLFELDLPEPPSTLAAEGQSEGEIEPTSAIEAIEILSGENEFLRWIQVRVIWDEGIFQRRVTRTTFGYDASLLQASAQAPPGSPFDAGGDPNLTDAPLYPGGPGFTAPRAPEQ